MKPLPAIPVELLLQQSSGLRALARGLLRDEHAAEEVVQETLAAAVRRPPADAARVGGWLARVTRRNAQRRVRGDARRRAREEHVSRAEALAPTDEVVARREVLRQVVDAVLALPEPYQSVVLLRYFEDLPPREIARRRGAKVGTVNSQLQRALAMLRGRLDAEANGQRGQWALALAAVTGGARGGAGAGGATSPPASLARRAGEVLAMHWKLSIGLAGALLVGLGYTSRAGMQAQETEEVTASAAQTSGTLDDVTPEGDGDEDGRSAAAAERRVASSAGGARVATAPSARFELELLVVDGHDVPMVGRAVVGGPLAHPRNHLGSTGWDGRLRVAFPAHRETLALALGTEHGDALRRVELRAGAPASLRLVARRPGGPTPPRAKTTPSAAEKQIVDRLEGLGYVQERERGGSGQPLAEILPAGDGLSLFAWPLPAGTAEHEEHRPADASTGVNVAEIRERTGGTLELLEGLGYVGGVAAPTPTRRVTVSGVVLDAAGEPAGRARLTAESAGHFSAALTGSDGSFEVEVQAGETLELSAGGGDLGLAAASFALDPESRHQRVAWNPRLDRGLEVRGRLRCPEGVDASGWLVLFDAGGDRALHQDSTLTRDGRFAIPNLPAGAGRLLVLRERDVFAWLVVENVLPGGADLELALGERELAGGDVALRVTDADGAALGEAQVVLWQLYSRRGAPLRYDAAEERYRARSVPPGRYRAIAGTPACGYRDLGELEVLSGERTDLGVVALERPGRLALTSELVERCAQRGLVLARRETPSLFVSPSWTAGAVLELPPGDCALVAPSEASAAPEQILRVEPGEAAAFDVDER